MKHELREKCGHTSPFSSKSNFCFCFAFFLCSTLSASKLIVSNTVSATSFCHLSEMTSGKFLYRSWSASVSLMPLVSSSSKEPISKASAAFTSPLGGMRGGVYFWRYTCCQSMPAKKVCSFTSSALLGETFEKIKKT